MNNRMFLGRMVDGGPGKMSQWANFSKALYPEGQPIDRGGFYASKDFHDPIKVRTVVCLVLI